MKNVYHALFHSYIRYGIVIWGHAAPAVLNPLQTLMNRVIRIMTYAPFGNVDLNPVYKELKLLQVSKVCSLETSKFVLFDSPLVPHSLFLTHSCPTLP